MYPNSSCVTPTGTNPNCQNLKKAAKIRIIKSSIKFFFIFCKFINSYDTIFQARNWFSIMENVGKNKSLLLFLLTISFLTSVLFWQVFVQNKIPFNANLLASFYNPWAQEKFIGWEHGIPNKPIAKDDLWIFYPQRTFTTSVLKKLGIPFWNPYSFSGNYHLGLSETAVFYPLNFLFLIFSQIDVWIFLIIIEPIIAGIGMYLFLKKIVSNEKSAIFGALAFAFSGIVIVRAVEGLSVGHTLYHFLFLRVGFSSLFIFLYWH